jgi:aminopeptidase-like protein
MVACDVPEKSMNAGLFCYELAQRLFPICRSITGPGVRETLSILAEHLPDLKMHDVPSGYEAFDWVVPDEWVMRDGFIEDESGQKIIDFKNHNLHVLGYSTPIDQWMTLEELDKNLHSLPEQPDAIPYVTSYYSRRWGFCLTHNQRKQLKPGKYRVVIDSELKKGKLDYADLILAGESNEEIFISSYVCHPSMANNELSGPVVVTALARWLMSLKRRKYTYRIAFIPETAGAIVYLSKNLAHLKKHVVAGYNATCIGDERAYSYLPSRAGDTLADQVALHVLKHTDPNFKRYSWLDRGSNERQYCAPGVDLPIATIMRSMFTAYPEYHTSLDNFDLVTPQGLQGGFDVLRKAVEVLENNERLKVTVLCEPQLGKRGLYPTLSTKDSSAAVATMMNMISYCDGEHELLEIAEILGEPMLELVGIAQKLRASGLME